MLKPAIVVLEPGKVMVVESVPAKVRELLTVRVLPFETVSVPVVEVMTSPLMEVAEATPNEGVVKVWLVAIRFPLENVTDVPFEVAPDTPANAPELLY